jgi:hypothetical protein
MQGENHPFTNVEPEGHVISKHEGDPKWKKLVLPSITVTLPKL